MVLWGRCKPLASRQVSVAVLRVITLVSNYFGFGFTTTAQLKTALYKWVSVNIMLWQPETVKIFKSWRAVAFRQSESRRRASGSKLQPLNLLLSCNCICKDDRNEIEGPDPVVKDLISYKIMKQFEKKGRLINGTETTIFVKYPIFRKA